MGMIINPYIIGGVAPTTAFTETLNSASGDIGGFTWRVVIGASRLSGSGSEIRVSFESAPLEGFAIDSAYVGHAGVSTPDFDGTQVQLLFGGGATKSISAASTVPSDFVSYGYDNSKDLIISYGITSQSNDRVNRNISATNVNAYTKSGLSEVGNTSISSMTYEGTFNMGIPLIEVK
jgi:hypothetical protein